MPTAPLLDRLPEVWNTKAGEPVPFPSREELKTLWDFLLIVSRHDLHCRNMMIAWLKCDAAKDYRRRLADCEVPPDGHYPPCQN